MIDALGRKIEVGDYVVFGKSNRDDPVNFGLVYETSDESIVILGHSNHKFSEISKWHVERRVFVINSNTLTAMDNQFSYNGKELEDN